jgi:hypothetical protein
MSVNAKQRKYQIPQLRVVFDTNILFTDSASDLVRQEAANLIKESKFPDLEIRWYLPEMVRHERQYQMQKRALELLPPIAKVERLLGHKLAITEQVLVDSVEKVVSQRFEELGLFSLGLDCSKVDWGLIALDAVYRRPPFKDGETEKGFRDRVIVECFLQLVNDSPKTPNICRIVLVSNDGLVAQTVKARTVGSTNTSVLKTVEELKGLINTLVSQVDEAFLALLKPKAEKLFFIPDDQSTLAYKERVVEQLKEKFASELSALPPGATSRKNGPWFVSAPNFVKKTGSRIQWASRIEVETEASKIVPYSSSVESPGPQAITLTRFANENLHFPRLTDLLVSQTPVPAGSVTIGGAIPLSTLGRPVGLNLEKSFVNLGHGGTVTTHRGVDVYEVLWSADVTTSKELRRPSIDEMKHGEPTWEQVT